MSVYPGSMCVCLCISLYTPMHTCASVCTWCVHLHVAVSAHADHLCERVTVGGGVCVPAHACDSVPGQGRCCRSCVAHV